MQRSSSATFNCSLQSISPVTCSVMSNHSMRQMGPAGSNYCGHCIAEARGDTISCAKQDGSHSYSNTSTFLSVCHESSNHLSHLLIEASPNPKPIFKASPDSNPDSNRMECPDCESLKEGQGECNGDHMSSACNGSPTFCDNSEDSIMQRTWKRPSPTAASCFYKDTEEEQEYFQQLLGSSSHGWTDEKHSWYLDSMEADFLRNVMFKSGVNDAEQSELDDSASSHEVKTSKAANKFKVCQNGRWRPVCVQAPYVNIGPLKQIAVAVKNPWIKHFKASKRAHFPSLIMEDPLLKGGNAHSRTWQQE